VDLLGPMDNKLQLPDLMISFNGRRKQANVMMGITQKNLGK